MSLVSAYERFLSAPSAGALSDTATYSYITSLQTFSGASPIVRHLQTQEQKVVKRKSWKTISSVEGKSSIAVEVETTIEFVSSGGAYLPGLDDFIIDHVATVPITHLVHFDRNDKIVQVRLSWDQASLLKQVEVIGSRGKNWPVYDGKDQIKLIVSGSSAAAAFVPATPPRGRNGDSRDDRDREFSPTKKHIKDPHTSLDLFSPTQVEERNRLAYPDAIAPRSPARPPPREHSELFAAGHEDLEASPGGTRKVNVRDSVIAPKGAGSRRFESARLFEDDQDYKEPKIYKTNPARYNHFEIGQSNEHDPMQFKSAVAEEPKKHIPLVSRTNKGGSQWDFEDFNTPAKVPQRYREQDQVNFSFDEQDHPQEEDEEVPAKAGAQHKARREQEQHFELRDDGTPAARGPYQPKPRKDAHTHFDFADEATPAPRRIIARTKAAAGLYADNQIYDEEAESGHAALSNVTNKGRSKAFSAQWEATDEPSARRTGDENKPAGRVGKALENHWSLGDEQQEAPKPAKVSARQQKDKNFWDF